MAKPKKAATPRANPSEYRNAPGFIPIQAKISRADCALDSAEHAFAAKLVSGFHAEFTKIRRRRFDATFTAKESGLSVSEQPASIFVLRFDSGGFSAGFRFPQGSACKSAG
jgi:hypothetical protein